MITAESDFLLGFAQRRRDLVRIAVFHPAAGKSDLAGMTRQMRGTLGQQYGKTLAPVDQPDQDRRGAQLDQRNHAGIEFMVAPVRPAATVGANDPGLEDSADIALGQAVRHGLYGVTAGSVSDSRPNGKNVCSLHTPSSIPCGVYRSSANPTSS